MSISTWPSRNKSVTVVTCEKGGDHAGERITLICTNLLCRADCLCCGVCFARKHSSHEVIEIDSLLDDIEEKWKTVQRKCELTIDSELDGSRAICSEAIASLQKYLEAKLKKLASKMSEHIIEARARNQREWAQSAQAIKQIRTINENAILQNRLLEILDSATFSSGRIQSFNPAILPNKGKIGDTINAFTQSFILTLKNIHSSVSAQYAKMCDPLAQPHHLKKDFFIAPANNHNNNNSNPSSNAKLSRTAIYSNASSSQNIQTSSVPSRYVSQQQQYSESDAVINDAINNNNQINDNFDTLSFSSKNNNNNNNNHNSTTTNEQKYSQQSFSSQEQRSVGFSSQDGGRHGYIPIDARSGFASQDGRSHDSRQFASTGNAGSNSSSLANFQQSHQKPAFSTSSASSAATSSAAIRPSSRLGQTASVQYEPTPAVVGFAGLSLQQSTISQNIPNISQLQQSQASLYQQIHQQQILLEQLAQKTNSVSSQQSTANVFGIVSQANQNQPAFGSSDNPPMFGSPAASTVVSEYKKSWVSNSQNNNNIVNGQTASQSLSNRKTTEGSSNENNGNTSLMSNNTSPPQRLLYYSSIFSQHMQGKSNLQLNPFSVLSQSVAAAAAAATASGNSVTTSTLSTSNQNRLNASTSSAKVSPNSSTTGIMHSRKGGSIASSVINAKQSMSEQRKPFTMEKLDDDAENDMEQDLVDGDLTGSTKIKDLPKSSERMFRYRFHKDFKHEFLQILDTQRSLKGASDNNETRLALLAPSVETKPLQECYWAFKVLSCKSIAYSSPLAIGLCLKKHVESSLFKFIGEDTAPTDTNHRSHSSLSRLQTSSQSSTQQSLQQLPKNNFTKSELSSHGCYLLTSAGFVRNHTDPLQDMKRVPVRFDQGDILHCHYNPFRKYLKIKNQTTGQFCMINVQTKPGDVLYPCVRISYCQDMVQVIDNPDSSLV